MIRSTMLAASILVLTCLNASAQTNPKAISGNQWVEHCKAYDAFRANSKRVDAADFGHCIGYTLAVADTFAYVTNTIAAANGDENTMVCFPGGVKASTLVEIGQKWFRENPDKRHRVAADQLVEAFGAAFECNKNQQPNKGKNDNDKRWKL